VNVSKQWIYHDMMYSVQGLLKWFLSILMTKKKANSAAQAGMKALKATKEAKDTTMTTAKS
jgi:hypothetical protein